MSRSRWEGTPQQVARQLLGAVEANRVSCEEFVIVEAGVYFVQMLFNRDAIFGEVVSNTYLTGDDQLVAAQEGRLLELGWLPPDVPCHWQCRRPHPNFHLLWSQEALSEDIVSDLLTALMVVTSRKGEGGPRFALIRGPRGLPPSSSLPTNH
jgi:hypothetical protein